MSKQIIIDLDSPKEKVKNLFGRVVDYVSTHKTEIIGAALLGTTMISEANKVARNVNAARNTRYERDKHSRMVYDRSSGVYLNLRRTMSPTEKVEYSIRSHDGERPVDILKDMGLL